MPVTIVGNNTPTAGGVVYGDGTNYASTTAGTSGGVLYSAGSSAPAFTAAGTSGQVLQSNGSGAPTWATPNSGAMVLLSTVTASNSATMDIETTFNSTYDKYVIIVTGLVCQTDGQQLRMLLKIGGTYLTTSTYVNYEIRTQSSSATYSGNNDSVSSPGTFVSVHSILGNVGGENASFNLYIQNPASTTLQKLYYFEGAGHTNAGEVRYIQGIGCNTGTAALTGVRFVMASGNITSGVARLYGIVNS